MDFSIITEIEAGHEQSKYSLYEKEGIVTLCVAVSSSGLQVPFVINISTINETASKFRFLLLSD